MEHGKLRVPGAVEGPGGRSREAVTGAPQLRQRRGGTGAASATENAAKHRERATTAEEEVPLVSAPTASSGGPRGAAGVVLITTTIVVDALAPLLQEHASNLPGFQSSSMVLAETLSYYLGGLALAVLWGGLGGLRRCLRPARYLAFLPASAAFSASNFMTYVAVRGLGGSQFYLLVQLRVAVLAVFLRAWSGVRQSTLAWISLAQLALGMIVLVHFKATAGVNCTDSSHQAAAAEQLAEAAAAAAERAEFVGGMVALIGVVLSSAFGFIYLEWQLKMHSQDPLFIQLHQMNSFGTLATLVIHATNSVDSTPGGPVILAANTSVTNVTEPSAAATTSLQPRWVGLVLTLWTCIVARGVLSGSVLKQLDSISKGLIDVTAIVLCTAIQIGLEGSEAADGTVIGLEALLLLSIVSYVIARAQLPQAGSNGSPAALEMRDMPVPRTSPKVL